jgi:hypothetical protein
MEVAGERLGQATSAKRGGEVVDEFRGFDEERIEAALDRAVGNRHGEMGFAPRAEAVNELVWQPAKCDVQQRI